MYDRDAQTRSALAAAALRQVTDQIEFDRIAAARDAALRLMALGEFDADDVDQFDKLLDAVEVAEEVLDGLIDEHEALNGLGDRQSRRERRAARKRRRKERRAARKARRAQRKADRKARRGKKGKARRSLRRKQYRARRKKYWGTLRKARKEHKKERKRIRGSRKQRRDRKKAGVSQTVDPVDTEAAAAASGEPPVTDETPSAAPVPFTRRPAVIFGGLVFVAVGVVVTARVIKSRKKKSKTPETAEEVAQ